MKTGTSPGGSNTSADPATVGAAMIMRWMLSMGLISGLALGTAHAEEEKYTMADLEALFTSEGWSELLAHAQDVRPSLRKKRWTQLLERAAVGHLELLMEQKQLGAALQESDGILVRFPLLKKSKSYMSKRGDVGLLAVETCFRESRSGIECVRQLRDFIETDPNNTDLAFKGGVVVRKVGKMFQSAPEFLVRGLSPKKGRKQRCQHEAVASSVFRSFGAPPDYDSTKAAMKIAFEYCYPTLRDRLMKAFLKSGGYESRNLCRGLMKKKARLSRFQRAYCQDQRAK